MSNLIVVNSLSKIYKSGKESVNALSNISFSVERGEFLTFSGASGSGKTTLLNLIGTLDSITSGNVVINGQSIAQMNEKEKTAFRRNTLGFVFQSYNLIPVLTALENVSLSFYPLKKEEKERLGLHSANDIKEASKQALDAVGLADYYDRKPGEMSGGQQQRVSIARAIARRSLLILADEPTANLDSKNSIMILDLFSELNKNYGITVICSSHDQDVLDKVNRTIILKDGVVIEDRRR